MHSTDSIEEYLKKYKAQAIEKFLRIKNKNREVVPFKLNTIQADMIRTRTGSDIYVKPRQIGASEVNIADVTLDTVFIPGTTTIIVAHEEEATKRLLAKSDYFYSVLEDQNIPGLPRRHHDSEFKKTFKFLKDPDNPKAGQIAPPSTLYIASARSFIIARGDTYHNIVADEFPFWPDPSKLYELLGGRTPNSSLVILGTPNGEDSQFYEMYSVAKERAAFGDNVYTAHFYRWFDHAEYSLPVDSRVALLRDQVSPLLDISGDEIKLIDNHGLTEGQIRWRRFKMAEMEQMRRMGETRVLFGQEFPEDDQTCFLSFGDQAYQPEILNELLKGCRQPVDHYNFADIWYPPELDKSYLVAVDPGLGRQSMTAITVWTFEFDDDGTEHPKHCATIHGLYDPERTKQMAAEIGLIYNTALMCPERNIETVARLLADYPRKYLFKDPFTNKQSYYFGWYTYPRTKPIMINELRMLLPKIITHDARLVKEIRNMRISPNNESVVFSSGLDDLHDSACIAMMCRPHRMASRGFAFNTGRTK